MILQAKLNRTCYCCDLRCRTPCISRCVGRSPDRSSQRMNRLLPRAAVPGESAARTFRFIENPMPSEIESCRPQLRIIETKSVSISRLGSRNATRPENGLRSFCQSPAMGALSHQRNGDFTDMWITAALLFHAHELPPYKKAVAIVSGGNVDPRVLAEFLAEQSVVLSSSRLRECQDQFGISSQLDASFCTRDPRAASRSTHRIQLQLGKPDHRSRMDHKRLAPVA